MALDAGPARLALLSPRWHYPGQVPRVASSFVEASQPGAPGSPERYPLCDYGVDGRRGAGARQAAEERDERTCASRASGTLRGLLAQVVGTQRRGCYGQSGFCTIMPPDNGLVKD